MDRIHFGYPLKLLQPAIILKVKTGKNCCQVKTDGDLIQTILTLIVFFFKAFERSAFEVSRENYFFM